MDSMKERRNMSGRAVVQEDARNHQFKEGSSTMGSLKDTRTAPSQLDKNHERPGAQMGESTASHYMSASGLLRRKHPRDQKPRLPPRRVSQEDPVPEAAARGDAPPSCPGRTQSSDEGQRMLRRVDSEPKTGDNPSRTRRSLSGIYLPVTTRTSAASKQDRELSAEAFQAMMEESSMIRDRKFRMRTYRQVFVGRECVDLLLNKGHCAKRVEAVELANSWLQQGLFHHVIYAHDFQDRLLYYRFSSTTELVHQGRKRCRNDTNSRVQQQPLPISMMASNLTIDEEEPLLSEDGAKTLVFPWSRKNRLSQKRRSSSGMAARSA